MTPQQLIDTSSRFQVYLEGVKSGHVRDFNGVFAKLDDVIRQTLLDMKVDVLRELSRPQLESLLADLEAKQVELFDEQTDHLLTQMPELAAYAAEFEAKAMKSVMTPNGRKGVKLPPAEKAFREATRRPVQATGELLEPLIKDWSRRAIKNTNTAVQIGYDQGLTVPQIVKKLQGSANLRFKDGITAVNKRQAATVVRTSVQHVASTAREVTYEENQDVVQGVEWVSTLDGHTTSQCRSLDGKKFKLKEGPRPPIHPNCRSCTAPDLVDEFDFLDEGATRSSKDGYVDAEETYYSWLQKQPPEFQDSVLGATRGKLFRDGGLTAQQFGDLQLDKNWEPITLAQMKEREPLAFQRAGLIHGFTPELEGVNRSPLAAFEPPTKAQVDSALVKLKALPVADPHEPGSIEPPIKQIAFDDMPKKVGDLFYDQEGRLALPSQIETVDPKDLLTSQGLVHGPAVEKYIKGGSLITEKGDDFKDEKKVPTAIRYQGKLYLVDGNHRTSAQILLDAPQMPIRIYDLDPQPKPPTIPGRPKAGTATGKVWDIADQLHAKLGRHPTRQEVLAEGVNQGINESTIGVQFGKWRKATGEAVIGPSIVIDQKKAVTQVVEAIKATPVEPLPQPKATSPKEAKWEVIKKVLDEAVKGTTPPKAINPVLQHDLDYVKTRLNTLHKKYLVDGVLNTDAMGWADRKELSELQANFRQLSGVDYSIALSGSGSREVIHKLLADVNKSKGYFTVSTDNALSATVKQKSREAQAFINSVTADKHKFTNFQVLPVDQSIGMEAYYNRRSLSVHLADAHGVDIHVHEIAHHIESEAGKKHFSNILDFLKERRGTERLRKYSNSKGYEKHLVFDDEWLQRGGDYYTSQIYKDNVTGKPRSTEVISMGAQRLFNDPLDFYERDPEHFELTIRVLLDL